LDLFLYFFSFSALGGEVEEQRDIVQEDVGCVGVIRLALEPHSVTTKEAKRMDSIDVVKRHSKNGLHVI
jgi:hypothetical protein